MSVLKFNEKGELSKDMDTEQGNSCSSETSWEGKMANTLR